MGSYRSKEDDVAKISTSIYVTNFPESFSAKDLFNSCKVYGHVVDSFIPSKRSKAGKRFGFVRFINVFSEERLVNNLCTIWVGRLKFHANIARFQRAPMSAKKNQPNIVAESNRSNPHSVSMGSDPKPAIALDDDCLLTKDLRNSLLGRVKEFASLSNLRTALINEGNTLKNLYPRIYALENSKQVTVCAKLADIALDASFRRKPRGGIECIQFNEMLVLMQDVSLTPISDRWIWSLEGSGDFSVASTRKAIDDKRLPVVNSKTRWIKSVPIKILSCALFVILAWSLLVISSSRVIWPDSFHVRSLNGGLPLLSKLIPMVNGALGSCRCGSPPNTN
ncbi:nucleotide-binding alpha-beta plait domain-containing protein [Tanacetum coccineum]